MVCVIGYQRLPGPHSGLQRFGRLPHIDKVKADARGFELDAAQLDGIEQKLDEIKDAITRVGRKDWVLIEYGTVTSMIVNDLVPPNVAMSILTSVVHGVAHIFGFGTPPPPIMLA